jgi:hypothetical protein
MLGNFFCFSARRKQSHASTVKSNKRPFFGAFGGFKRAHFASCHMWPNRKRLQNALIPFESWLSKSHASFFLNGYLRRRQ